MPAEVFPVGDFIQQEMDARGWTVEDLAAHMGSDCRDRAIDRLTVELLLAVSDKKISLDEETARKLGMAFGVSPELFLNIDKAWRANG